MRYAYRTALNEYLHSGEQSMEWVLDQMISDGVVTVDMARRIEADIRMRYKGEENDLL